MPAEELWSVEDKHDVDVHRALGAEERLDGRLDSCYVLEWRPGDRGRNSEALDAQQSLEVLRSVRKDFGPFDIKGDQRDLDVEYGRIARRALVTRVTGKADPAAFARQWPGEPVPGTRRR
jgi:hypothetical protein